MVGHCTAKSRKGNHPVAASVPTCFSNGFELVPVDSMAAPREDCFAVVCLPHRIVAFPNGFQGFPITVVGCVSFSRGRNEGNA